MKFIQTLKKYLNDIYTAYQNYKLQKNIKKALSGIRLSDIEAKASKPKTTRDQLQTKKAIQVTTAAFKQVIEQKNTS